jgi:hypothetical protein
MIQLEEEAENLEEEQEMKQEALIGEKVEVAE